MSRLRKFQPEWTFYAIAALQACLAGLAVLAMLLTGWSGKDFWYAVERALWASSWVFVGLLIRDNRRLRIAESKAFIAGWEIGHVAGYQKRVGR